MRAGVQTGKVLDLAAPYDRTAGQGALIGSIFGVAANDVLSGVTGEFVTRGVFSLTKAAGAWTVGALIYWDNSAKDCTTTSSGNHLIGAATVAALSGDANGTVRLNGNAVVAS